MIARSRQNSSYKRVLQKSIYKTVYKRILIKEYYLTRPIWNAKFDAQNLLKLKVVYAF